MILSFFASLWLGTAGFDSRLPDPMIGISVRFSPERVDDDIRRRRKFLDLALPFEVSRFDWGDAESLRFLTIPELLFNNDVIVLQLTFGLDQLVPIMKGRSVPEGFFWGLALGPHFGYITNRKDYLNGAGEFLNTYERVSLAGVLKAYVGPSFWISEKMALRVPLGADLSFGKLARYTVRFDQSNLLGLLLFGGLQIDFR